MSRSPDRMNIDGEVKNRGRGFSYNDRSLQHSFREDSKNEQLAPVRSIEGWIVIVRGLHEEADEESLADMFTEYGKIKNIHLNLDRCTGFVKGYALIEYESRKEAAASVEAGERKHLGKTIQVDYAFVTGSSGNINDHGTRGRSLSPERN